jgi:signal transduction histidine kinase
VALDTCGRSHGSRRPMKRIATRFALMMAAAAVLPLLAFGALSIFSVRDGAEQAIVNGNLNVARRTAAQIENDIANSVKILKALAADLQHTGLDQWQQDRILKNFALEFPDFGELTLLDEAGTTIATSRLGRATIGIPDSDGVEIGGVLMTRFSVDDDLLPTAVAAVHLSDTTNGGWLVGRLSLEEMWRMVDSIRVGDGGRALVVTADGQLLAHGDPASKSRVARRDTMERHQLVADINAQQGDDRSANAQYVDEVRGEVAGVAAYAPLLGWTVIVEQPVEEAFAIPTELQGQLQIFIAVALMAMLGVGYFWGRSFINPILRLTRSTGALAAGRLDERVTVTSSDELGQLGNAFNEMAGRLEELQEDIKKKERQAMFGRISLGLVHDLSVPMQNIGNTSKLMMKMWDDLEYREVFKRTVERELTQIRRLLDDLRNLAKPVPLEKVPLDANRALADLAESMKTTAETGGIELDTELVFGPAYFEGDLFAFNRVCRNLIINALQATPPRGRVSVRTLRQNDNVVIEVADTGCGIPPERIGSIFDDFATTKRRGLGLGLAVSKRMVEQLGGTIAVSSQVNVGTTFTLTFPLTKARPTQLQAV